MLSRTSAEKRETNTGTKNYEAPQPLCDIIMREQVTVLWRLSNDLSLTLSLSLSNYRQKKREREAFSPSKELNRLFLTTNSQEIISWAMESKFYLMIWMFPLNRRCTFEKYKKKNVGPLKETTKVSGSKLTRSC